MKRKFSEIYLYKFNKIIWSNKKYFSNIIYKKRKNNIIKFNI